MTLSLKPVLSRSEVERIHDESLRLLQDVGVDYGTPKAVEILKEAGCPVDDEYHRVRLPPELVEWAVAQTRRVIRLAARDPARDVVLDGRSAHHTTDSQGTQAIDLESGECRSSSAEDLRRGLTFADALDQIDIVNVMVAATDVPAHLRTIQHFALAFSHTSKHVRTGVLNAAQVPYIVELVRAALGDEDGFRPIFSAVDCTISPLMHDGPMTEACIELARLAVPIMVYPMPLAGGTSPVTLAGTILLHNVEFLSGLVLFQLVNPGTPLIYGTGASQLNMLTGHYEASANAHSLHLALADLARFYHLPVNIGGLSTASQALDAHYGHEATAACLLAHLAGADEVYSMGLLGSAQVLSLEKMVLDNHLARQIRRMIEPIPMDDAHLQTDLIEAIGIGGHFLKARETRAFTRREYMPVWPPSGENMRDIARKGALEILHQHRPPDLPPGAAARMAEIIAEADQTLA
jgi:trimethylamine--corrinoid protein Co-methyltransferase